MNRESKRPGDRFRAAFERFERAAKYGSGADINRAMRGVTREARRHSVVIQFPMQPRRSAHAADDVPPAA